MRALAFAPFLLLPVVAGVGCERPSGEVPESVFGHCIYENRFSGLDECREFRGDGWTESAAQASCDEYEVDLELSPCPYPESERQGACVTTTDPELTIQLVIAGEADGCPSAERGCELFGGGTWVEGEVCGGGGGSSADDVFDPDNFYIPETLECVEPLAGEPVGQSADGKVCTFQQISGCTEEGRNFEDYASCDVVRTQRPYSPVPPNDTEPANDPRLQDADYAAELAWVKGQLNSCACACCHKDSITPNGAAIFDTDAAGNFANTFTNYGLAFAARAFDSSYLGNYPAAENNGFSRDVAGLPSTDQQRMKAFFTAELEHRGSSVDEFSDLPPQPEIFYRQAIFEPEACENGEGVDDDGIVRWRGGRARYLHILEVGSVNPGNPPDLDTPDGSLWRVGTLPPTIPMKTGEVVYGSVPDGHAQKIPETGEAPALVAGRDYVIFAFADIGIPMTRCIFTAQ